MFYVTRNKSFVSVLAAINEVHRRLFYILDDIYIFFRLEYDIIYVVVSFWFPLGFDEIILLQIFNHVFQLVVR